MLDLRNVDCYDEIIKIPDKSVDLIYTDPPYKVGIFKEGSGGTVNKIGKLDKTLIPINEITQTGYNLYAFCEQAVRVLKEINIYIWCNKAQIIDYFNFFVNRHNCKYEILVWNKTNVLPTYSNKYIDDCEYCLYFHKGKGKCFPKNYEDAKKVYLSPINRQNKLYNHPNIKPLEFVKAHISNSSKPNDIVLDPFMGSGTTGIACKQLGRQFIGFEISSKYFNVANERINNCNNIKNKKKNKLI